MMDDAALERGLRARPPADPAYVSRITATPPVADRGPETPVRGRTTARTRTVPSLSWLVVVIALVVLSAGALSLLTRQSALIGPAASPSSSPSAIPPPTPVVAPDVSTAPDPSPGPDPFAGFVTREVEPSVHRIDNDGVRSLTWSPSRELGSYCCHFARGIGVGPDGAAWLLRPDAYFRLGGATNHQYGGVVDERMRDLVVTGTGESTRLWRVEQDTVMSSAPGDDSDAWRKERDGRHLAATADGVLWTTERDGEGVRLWRGGAGDWVAQPGPGSDGARFDGLWVDDTGSVWLSRGPFLVRSVNGDWQWLRVPSGEAIAADVGLGGVAWAWTGDTWARYTEPSWTTFGADILQPPARVGGHTVDPVVASDGSLWYPPDHSWRGCDGVVRFDGAAADRYLESLCVYGLEAAPDGTVWVLAGDDYRADPRSTVQVYAIAPEARMPG